MEISVMFWSVLVFIIFVIVALVFLWHKKIGSSGFGWIVISFSIGLVLIFRSDAISNVAIECFGGKVLTEMRDIQKDIYAKVSTVKKIAESSAKLAEYTVLSTASPVTHTQRLEVIKSRDNIIVLMEAVGADPGEIKELKGRFNKELIDYITTVLVATKGQYNLNPELKERIAKDTNQSTSINSKAISEAMAKINHDVAEDIPGMVEDLDALLSKGDLAKK